MRRHILTVFTLFISSLTLLSQVYDPVKWNFASTKKSGNVYELRFTANIQKGWHMYGLNIPEGGPVATSFNFENDSLLPFKGKITPVIKPLVEFDSTFMFRLELFYNKAVFTRNIGVLPGKSMDIKGYVRYMVCDNARCLPPKDVNFSFQLKGGEAKGDGKSAEAQRKDENNKKIENEGTSLISVPQTEIDISKPAEQKMVTASKNGTRETQPDTAEKSLWGLFFVALLAGFGGSITPCVYPVIPLTITYFMKENSRSKAIFNGIFFGLSIIFIYTLVGLIAGLFHVDLVHIVSSSWIANLIIFLLFLAMAASFFGMFELTLPGRLSNALDQQVDKGGFFGPFFMALATAVISFSCTGFIVGIVLGSGLKGDVVRPVVGMFGYSLTFALPFTLLAIFPNMLKNLPKSGGWLNAVKVVFAFVMLLGSLIFLGNLGVSRQIVLALGIVLSGLLGLYLIGKIKFEHDTDLKHVSVPRIALAIFAFGFAIYMVPGLFGAPLNSIAPFLPPQETTDFTLLSRSPGSETGTSKSETSVGNICVDTPKYSQQLKMPLGLRGYFDYDEALACARQLHKPVLLDFGGHSCKNCKKMYAEVWSKPEVYKKLKNDFVLAALYTDDGTELPQSDWFTSNIDGKVKKTIGDKFYNLEVNKFGTNALPLYAIVDENGNVLTKEKYVTYSPKVQLFLDFLNDGIKSYAKPENISK